MSAYTLDGVKKITFCKSATAYLQAHRGGLPPGRTGHKCGGQSGYSLHPIKDLSICTFAIDLIPTYCAMQCSELHIVLRP